jgi:hypothetical protein
MKGPVGSRALEGGGFMNRIRNRHAVMTRTAIPAALAVSALFAGACLATPALAAAQHPDGSWSGQQQVPKIASSTAPAECVAGKTWYVAFTNSTGGIEYATHTTSWWNTIRTVSGTNVTPLTTSAPAIIVYNGDLYVFWVNSSGFIRYSDRVGSTWEPTRTISGSWGTAKSSATPSVTISFGALWVGYKGHSTSNIWYTSTTNGSTWAKQQVAVKNATSYSPTIAPTFVAGAPVAFAWTESSGKIGYGILGFLGFESIGTVPEAGTNAAPVLDFMSAAPGETMYLAWKGTSTDKVFYDDVTDFSDSTFGPGTWAGQASLTAFTSTGPALADSGTTLYAVYKGSGTQSIYYESATNPNS